MMERLWKTWAGKNKRIQRGIWVVCCKILNYLKLRWEVGLGCGSSETFQGHWQWRALGGSLEWGWAGLEPGREPALSFTWAFTIPFFKRPSDFLSLPKFLLLSEGMGKKWEIGGKQEKIGNRKFPARSSFPLRIYKLHPHGFAAGRIPQEPGDALRKWGVREGELKQVETSFLSRRGSVWAGTEGKPAGGAWNSRAGRGCSTQTSWSTVQVEKRIRTINILIFIFII